MNDEEKLLEFLYLAPVGLIAFNQTGDVAMANPRVAQLFNRFAPGGYFANFFAFLDDFLPELREEIERFNDPNGQILENKRYSIKVPGAEDDERMYFDITVARQDAERYFASINNVTSQVEAENKRFITEQRLNRFFEGSTRHIFFTIKPDGLVDSWNRTGETYLCTSDDAIAKPLNQVIPIEAAAMADYLKVAKNEGLSKSELSLVERDGTQTTASLCISKIHDVNQALAGFSVVLTLN